MIQDKNEDRPDDETVDKAVTLTEGENEDFEDVNECNPENVSNSVSEVEVCVEKTPILSGGGNDYLLDELVQPEKVGSVSRRVIRDDDPDKSDIDDDIDDKEDEIKLRLEKICEETSKNNSLIKELQTTKGDLTPRSDSSGLTDDARNEKCDCCRCMLFGCSCKRENKIKKMKIKYEEPVYTDKDDPNVAEDVWTTQRKHHFQKCLWKLKYNRVVSDVYLNELKKQEEDWSWRLISLSTFTSGLTIANNVEEEPIKHYDIIVNGTLTFMSMLTSFCAAWMKKKNFVEKINEIDKYLLNINRLCEELDVQFSILDTDRLKYTEFKDIYISQITTALSTSPMISPEEWKNSIKDITLKYPELINPDNSEENKLWPWFGDMVKRMDGEKEIYVRKQTAFMYQMRNTRSHKLKSSCCFKNKRVKKDIYT